jgi:hypothetical protein
MTFARTTKFVLTIALFAVAAAMVWVADAVNSTGPLFAGWVPLLIVPWVLTRPEGPAEVQLAEERSAEDEDPAAQDEATAPDSNP